MTNPTKAVQIRRIEYSQLAQPLTAVLYDDQTDIKGEVDVLDRVLADNPSVSVTGYASNGTQNVPTVPTVTLEKVTTSPTQVLAIKYNLVFSESVTGLVTGTGDLILSGSALPTTVAISGSASTYSAWVSGMSTSGTVSLYLPAGKVVDADGFPNDPSTSVSNEVVWY